MPDKKEGDSDIVVDSALAKQGSNIEVKDSAIKGTKKQKPIIKESVTKKKQKGSSKLAQKTKKKKVVEEQPSLGQGITNKPNAILELVSDISSFVVKGTSMMSFNVHRFIIKRVRRVQFNLERGYNLSTNRTKRKAEVRSKIVRELKMINEQVDMEMQNRDLTPSDYHYDYETFVDKKDHFEEEKLTDDDLKLKLEKDVTWDNYEEYLKKLDIEIEELTQEKYK